tara:strand:+ start:1227 stop:1364 length:138 start_codon:yes stop_codon:yes gene_type:complete
MGTRKNMFDLMFEIHRTWNNVMEVKIFGRQKKERIDEEERMKKMA